MKRLGWKSTRKGIGVERVSGHTPKASRLVNGRAPENSLVDFTPAELFGAMAQCSSRGKMDQAAAKAHVEACRLLISRHVDEEGDQFAVLGSVRELKDYFRKAMTGLVGDGIAYLQMVRDGYRWLDHFENHSAPGTVSTGRTPDFIFSRSADRFVALTEAKATKGTSKGAFDRTVGDGYLGQIEPYLGERLGGFIATHGFAVGSWMTSDTRAEIFIHHTGKQNPPGGDGDGDDGSSDPSAVRFGSYCGVLTLLFGPDVGGAARAKTWRPSRETFTTVEWLGRTWIVGENAIDPLSPPPNGDLIFPRIWSFPWLNGFALDLETARRIFDYMESNEPWPAAFETLPEFSSSIQEAAKEAGGAIFPDGFAVLGRTETLSNLNPNRVPPRDEDEMDVAEAEDVEVLQFETVQAEALLAKWDQTEEVGEEEEVVMQRMIYLTNG